jgi:hypothetical protein
MRDHAVELVGPERAALAAFIPVGREHEMLHHELAVCAEQIGERLAASRPFENEGLVHLDPGQRATLLVQPVASAGKFLFAGQQGLAGFSPFVPGNDPARLHGELLCQGACLGPWLISWKPCQQI